MKVLKAKVIAMLVMSGLVMANSIYLQDVFAVNSQFNMTGILHSSEQFNMTQILHESEQKAMSKYMSYYQFANLEHSKRDWTGLDSIATDETSRGRNIDQQARISLHNAIAQYDDIHVRQLYTNDSYQWNTASTDTIGRDRNTLIENARAQSLVQAHDALSQMVLIQQDYSGFEAGQTTDSVTYDRQTLIAKNADDSKSRAEVLVSHLAKISENYVHLDTYLENNTKFVYHEGSVTNLSTHSQQTNYKSRLDSAEKATLIFNEIHAKHLQELQSPNYGDSMDEYPKHDVPHIKLKLETSKEIIKNYLSNQTRK